MKICKKVALILIILILSTTLNVYAADYADTPTSGVIAEVTLTQSSTTAKVGETVTITISAKHEKGIEGVDATLEYDKTKLELTGLEAKNHFASHSDTDGETGEFIFSVLYGEAGAPEEAPTEADLATLSLKVLGTATTDETLTIKLSGIEVIDPNVDSTTVKDQEVKLTIVGEQEPEGEEPEGGEPEGGEPEGGEPEGGEPEGGEPEGGEPEGGEPEGGEPEGGEAEGGEPKDPTIADKPMNNAGIDTYGFVAIVIVIAVFVLYTKYKKYRDIK